MPGCVISQDEFSLITLRQLPHSPENTSKAGTNANQDAHDAQRWNPDVSHYLAANDDGSTDKDGQHNRRSNSPASHRASSNGFADDQGRGNVTDASNQHCGDHDGSKNANRCDCACQAQEVRDHADVPRRPGRLFALAPAALHAVGTVWRDVARCAAASRRNACCHQVCQHNHAADHS